MKGWGCNTVVQHLPSMHEVIGLIPQHQNNNNDNNNNITNSNNEVV
jgi:hypothetical protein